jgi:hypothetical protein
MFRRAQRIAIATLVILIPCAAGAQSNLQPAPAPVVTAETTSWYRSGEPIEWNSARYYPAGVIQFFNGNQMVRSGTFRGIPLYVDAGLEPNSIVFVPLSGGRMQPYERPRTGELAGTTGSRMPSLPPGAGEEATPVQLAALLAADSQRPSTLLGAGAIPQPIAVGTSGRTLAAPARPETTLQPPTGLNAIWIRFDGRRWISAGKAIDYDAPTLTQIGTYRGWSVYIRNGDRSIIYIPATPGRLAAYKAR